MPSSRSQLVTWRTTARSYMWRPWILSLDGSLGLTKTRRERSDSEQDGTLVTGSLGASLFPQSRFPLRAYFDSRNSNVDAVLGGLDLRTTTYGVLQQYSPLSGGAVSLDFRRSENAENSAQRQQARRDFVTDILQLNATKSLGRNNLRFLSSLRQTERSVSAESEIRKTFSLRHRYRSSPRFYIEDTTFFNDEALALDGLDISRQFLQLNGIATWRPDIEKPLLVSVRGLVQGVDSRQNGTERESENFSLTTSATYQWSDTMVFAANAGYAVANSDRTDEHSTVFQRVRSTFRANRIEFGRNQYRWGSSIEAGNRSDQNGVGGATQDIVLSLNHSLTRNASFASGRQLQVSFSQQGTSTTDTEEREEYSLINGVFVTLNRQNGRTSSYLRLSATDRRLFGERDTVFQLVNFQASIRSQRTRNRSWNGGITVQYGLNSFVGPGDNRDDNESVSYSANLTFVQRQLFGVPRLNLTSELRLLSSDFRSDELLEETLGIDPDRDDQVWRNRLDYRVGKLEFRLLTDLREINEDWQSQVFLQVRRYYGTT